MTEADLLVRGIDEGLQDVVHFLPRAPALLNYFEEDVLDLSVSSVSFPNQKKSLKLVYKLLVQDHFTALVSFLLKKN